MNLAILVGVIASEIKTTPVRDGSVTRFRLRTTEQYTLDGEVKERSQTHLIDVWNAYLQKNVIPLLRQGELVEIQGSIESRNMAREGEQARWTTSIVLRGTGIVNILGGRASNTSVRAEAQDDPTHGQPRGVRTDHRPRQATPLGAGAGGGAGSLDDDVPF